VGRAQPELLLMWQPGGWGAPGWGVPGVTHAGVWVCVVAHRTGVGVYGRAAVMTAGCTCGVERVVCAPAHRRTNFRTRPDTRDMFTCTSG
jgi:hypothetical protein